MTSSLTTASETDASMAPSVRMVIVSTRVNVTWDTQVNIAGSSKQHPFEVVNVLNGVESRIMCLHI